MLQRNVNGHDEWVIVGKFGRPHGVKGLITVISFTEPRENILHYTPWYIGTKEGWQPLTLQRADINNKLILAQLECCHDREQAAHLTNTEIAVRRAQFPELKAGEYYWHQLIGMDVINLQGITLGTISEIMPTGSNDVLVISGQKRFLIPYLPGHYVLEIDDQKNLITVDWDVDF
ncbi:ribosome maturation factor RimM [Legionella oakridgensis]|uniref:Ribosome maturation factor RimM n=2 Tax=Legionella oakridgensis TaxID=29423 RepID=W0BBN1_9GAMM|nr:ribosome maturation factor RimM [Legionella oakridgensis]AHE66037.1 16S rRNA processing protein RimM [Legionella oakridgensis ATCC 33761 = DSM 21215]ETO94267.1 16S rRNA processing protein RimM [Legionella oakridgensis RV-2-2007]KTD43556.1 16S rRNA-processing protein RimM [Legionella oakridgensis]STY15961.1 16S rRNA-processing protein RimM [Legionella longbeachae]